MQEKNTLKNLGYVYKMSFGRFIKLYQLIGSENISEDHKMQLTRRREYLDRRSPTLQTVLMVERFINENSGEYKKTQLWKQLPKKVMWPTFQVILDYLESIHKITYDQEGHIVYIWNPEFLEKVKERPAIKL